MKEKKSKKRCARTSIGGQAVMEGVMMRSQKSMATAVRDADGVIRLETKRLKNSKASKVISKIPLVRGVVSFVSSLFGGTSVLMRSAEVYGEGEPSKFEKWVSEKLKIDVMSVVGFISVLLGLALAVFLFMWAPQALRGLIEKWVGEGFAFDIWAKNFIEGGIKLLLFIAYLLLVSLLKDIRRTFMYHGAEHKTIACFERGLDLTVDNAKKCPRVHDRCGTTFMVFVLVISILAFACFEALVVGQIDGILRVLCKVALLPVVAGLSYELLKLLSKLTHPAFIIIKWPGLLLQRITTREPDDKMLEVAIASFKAVMEMDADDSILEKKFQVAKKRRQLTYDVKAKLKENGITEDAEAEWIISIVLGVKRDEVYKENLVYPKKIDEIDKIVNDRITGRPLWYCIGDTEFYGYKIKVDERVLIPRPETELLVYNAKESLSSDKTVLDLCTGSGAIAISVQKETGATVTASDISENALSIAKENAKINGANVNFVQSNLFENIEDKFDMIISNPPYIKSKDIATLQKEVKDFEPTLALDGGVDGLDFYKKIALQAKNHLNKGGILLLECGIGQAQDVADMLKDYGTVKIIKDYENIDRIVKAVLDV
ncbi:MAG: peptide chain release factor N(5)-glutamine methyltransferase [Clostridia bacterium]|nr:peptide chain release factor N(5)-glutamine methyltransferase [Clostridia bacterium]